MNITLTDTQLTGLAFATAKRNAANPSAVAMTDEQFAADLLGVQCDKFAADKSDAEKAAMAANERLMALGAAVMAQPDKLDAVEAAVETILKS